MHRRSTPPVYEPELPPFGRSAGARQLLSVLVPLYNEAQVLPEFHERLTAVLVRLPMAAEVVYVDDGSTDGSREVLARLRRQDPRISVVALSRNFGKETAMAAGLDHVHGDAVVIIDADLQDPPELIPRMIDAWHAGADQVEMKRSSRQGETLAKRWTAHAFYRAMQCFTRVDMTPDVGDFRLLSRRAVEALRKVRERSRFMKGLYAWIGYRRIQLDYERAPRFAGTSKWNYWRLWNLALEGFTSFTIAPLKVASYLGLLVSLAAFAYGVIVVVKTLFLGDPVSGYPSLMAVMLFLGGVQLLCIGVVGEYLGRMFVETKDRPLYLIDRYYPPRMPGSANLAGEA